MKKVFIFIISLMIISLFSIDLNARKDVESYNDDLSLFYEAMDSNDIVYIQEIIDSQTNEYIINEQIYTYDNELSGSTSILYSLYHNYTNVVDTLLSYSNIDLSITDDRGWNALMYAAAYSDISIFTNVLYKDTNHIYTSKCSNINILHIASKYNNYEIISYVVTNLKIDIDVLDSFNSTPLHYAANNSSIESYRELIKLGANTTIRDNSNNYAEDIFIKNTGEKHLLSLEGINKELFIAVENNNVDMVKNAVRNGANINIRDGFGLGVLHNAIKYNSLDSIKYLLSLNGIDIERKLPSKYVTYLGRNINQATYIGEATPLLYAIFRNNYNISELLLKHNANINAKDEEGWNTFLYASSFSDSKMIRLLLSHNEELSKSYTKDNLTGLHLAVIFDNMRVVKYLVENANIDINYQDKDGWTALHYAAYNKKNRIYNLLIRLGADISIKNNDNETADMLL